jgi:hypothetical protein
LFRGFGRFYTLDARGQPPAHETHQPKDDVMLNKSHFDWNDMQELQEIGLIALVYPEAVERLFAHIPDANPDVPRRQRSVLASRGTA